MKEKIYRMEFHAGGAVTLYDEHTGIDGRPVLTLCSEMDGVESARAYARRLCPDGYKLRLLNMEWRPQQ